MNAADGLAASVVAPLPTETPAGAGSALAEVGGGDASLPACVAVAGACVAAATAGWTVATRLGGTEAASAMSAIACPGVAGPAFCCTVGTP
jgi:hypothetical protein